MSPSPAAAPPDKSRLLSPSPSESLPSPNPGSTPARGARDAMRTSLRAGCAPLPRARCAARVPGRICRRTGGPRVRVGPAARLRDVSRKWLALAPTALHSSSDDDSSNCRGERSGRRGRAVARHRRNARAVRTHGGWHCQPMIHAHGAAITTLQTPQTLQFTFTQPAPHPAPNPPQCKPSGRVTAPTPIGHITGYAHVNSTYHEPPAPIHGATCAMRRVTRRTSAA